MPKHIRNAQLITLIMIFMFIILSAILSIIKFTSPVGMWAIINVFQMLMLLILTGAFIPETVREYLLGMDFTLFSFNFIPFIKIPGLSNLYSWMGFEQYNTDLNDIGVEYSNSFINNMSFLFTLLIFIAVHIPIALMYSKAKSKTNT